MPGPPELVHRLYRTPPDGFVAARDAAVAEARPAGDQTPPANSPAAQARPSPPGWSTCSPSAGRSWSPTSSSSPPRCGPPSASCAGPGCGSCPRSGGGWSARWSPRSAAGRGGAGPPPAGKLPLAEVEATLNAAFSDAEVAEQVRVRPAAPGRSYAGFGEVPRPQLRLVTGGTRSRRRNARPAGPEPARASAAARPHGPGGGARRAGRAARAAGGPRERARRPAPWPGACEGPADQERAEAALAEASGRSGTAPPYSIGIEAALAELERRRAAAEQEVGRRKLARRAAERAVTVARRRAGEVEAAIEARGRRGGCGRGRWGGRLRIDGRRRVCGPPGE